MAATEALIQAEFPINNNKLYLNHAAVAPWPKRTTEAVRVFAEECFNEGAAHYPRWMETEQSLRDQLCKFINAGSSDDIGLVKNTSEALSMVAHGFPWKAGDNVVISDEEFPSNRIVWESLKQSGVAVKEVSLKSSDPEQALIDAADNNTRLISISSVEYASGLRIDLKRLGKLCKQRNIAFCVDAIQGLGVFEHDVQAMHIDFLMADAHKWLLAPEGIAVFYCRPEWRGRLTLYEYGWHMVEQLFEFDNRKWQPARSARRFECGSSNMLGIHAFHASLSLLIETGIDEIERRALINSEHLFRLINDSPDLELLNNTEPGRYAGIVIFKHRKIDNESLFNHLTENNVVCAKRGGGIRFSPHFYTRESTLQKAVQISDFRSQI
jgi:selenocysteine lyase/cysteine desulfurase